MARDYVAKGKAPPGVRGVSDPSPWPSVFNSRAAPANSNAGGGEYVACRRFLLSRFAAKWMLALHDLDQPLYAKSLFDQCVDIADEMNQQKVADLLTPETQSESQEVRRLKTTAYTGIDSYMIH